MGIKEDFAAFKTAVDAKLTSIEAKLNNPATPAEVTAGMQAITTKLDEMDLGVTGGGGEPL